MLRPHKTQLSPGSPQYQMALHSPICAGILLSYSTTESSLPVARLRAPGRGWVRRLYRTSTDLGFRGLGDHILHVAGIDTFTANGFAQKAMFEGSSIRSYVRCMMTLSYIFRRRKTHQLAT